MWSNEFILDLFEVVKKHKAEIEKKGYIGQDKGMSTVVTIEIDKNKEMDIILKFSGQGWPKKGKGKKEKLSL